MFEGPEYPKPLDEDLFDQWLVNGRESKIKFEFMLIVWDDIEHDYTPVYVESRTQILEQGMDLYGESMGTTSIVAAYNLYSEAKVGLH